MTRILLLAPALVLAACGSSDEVPSNGATVVDPAAPTPEPAADTNTKPAPASLKTFGNWTAGCDNVASCQAGALLDEDADAPPVLMAIQRAAGPAGAMTVRFQIDSDPPVARPLTVAVDDRPVVRVSGRTGDSIGLTGAATLVAALVDGRTLRIDGAAGQPVGTISLTGASAALRWIDVQQRRAGTTGAIVARGNGPDTRPAPALPIVRSVAIGAATTVDPALTDTMRRTAGCEADGELPDTIGRSLGGGRTLALVPCLMGAYNLVSAAFVIERGNATPAAFDAPTGMDSEVPGIAQVVNADIADGMLVADAKGRGLGDCGIRQRFAWDGTRFRLVRQDEMTECRGSIDYIRTWTARTVRETGVGYSRRNRATTGK